MVTARSNRPDKFAACVRHTRGEAGHGSASSGRAAATAGVAGAAG